MMIGVGISLDRRADASGPVNFAGLMPAGSVLQYMRSDIGFSVAGSDVTWLDQSGNGKNYTRTVAGPGNAPSASVGVKGKAGVLFGANAALYSSLALPAPGTTPTFLWLVARVNSWVLGNTITIDSTSLNFQIRQVSSSPTLRTVNPAASDTNSGLTIGAVTRIEAAFTNSLSDFLKVASTQPACTVTAGNGSSVGQNLGNQFNASVFEVFALMYANVIPSVGVRAALDAAAFAEYGALV